MISGSDCTIRRMRAADVETVLTLAAALEDAPQWPAGVYLAALDPERTPKRIALVAEIDQSPGIIGFAVASLLPPQAELESIGVRADQRRRGVGRRLIDELVSELSAAAVSEVLLEVRASNRTACNFYTSGGWRQTGTRARYYSNPEEGAILMSLAVGS